MAKDLLQQAKTAADGTLGLDYTFGALMGIKCQEVGDEQLVSYNESPVTYIQLGVLLERRRAAAERERLKPKRGRPPKNKEVVGG